jgi:coenzyme F420-0:L-glutamate ligase
MQLLPIATPILKEGDDIAAVIRDLLPLQNEDIVVLSSKAVATVEGAAIDLSHFKPTREAEELAAKTGTRTPAFIQAVLEETARLQGTVTGTCPGALLTEVKPEGLTHGTILTANAGLDESNIKKGFCIGWPRDPAASARRIREALESMVNHTLPPDRDRMHFAVLLTDSCCRPRRLGVTAFTLTASGLEPLRSEAGRTDLFGKKLRITSEAVADQLATAANFLMGNAEQSVPAVVIRNHGLTLSNVEGWVPGIEPEEDLFRGII